MSILRNTSQSGGLSGPLTSLASLAALVVTIFVGPQIWPVIGSSVTRNLSALYEPQLALWIGLGLHGLIYPIVFSGIRLGLMAALTVLVVKASKRLV